MSCTRSRRFQTQFWKNGRSLVQPCFVEPWYSAELVLCEYGSKPMTSQQTPTLAELLGIPPHRSFLLRKLRLLGVDAPEKLIALAIQRGCYHYENGLRVPYVPESRLSNEQLAVALLSPNNPYHSRLVRAGAQLLSGDEVDLDVLVNEAVKERSGEVLLHVAKAGRTSEPDNPKWDWLIQLLLGRHRRLNEVKPGVLPSDSRFCIESGFAGRKRLPHINRTWLRPIRARSSGY